MDQILNKQSFCLEQTDNNFESLSLSLPVNSPESTLDVSTAILSQKNDSNFFVQNGQVPMTSKHKPISNYNMKIYSFQELIIDDDKTDYQSQNVIVKALGYQINRSDLYSITSGAKLNDILVNFYIKLVCNSTNVFKCSSLDSLISHKILFGTLRGVPKSVEKFNKDDFRILFCPVFIRASHWALIVFDKVARTITYFDSIFPVDNEIVSKISFTLGKYIKCLDGSETWQLLSDFTYPKQNSNDKDCGVFICLYAKYFAFERQFDFNQNVIPTMRQTMSSEILNFQIEETFTRQ